MSFDKKARDWDKDPSRVSRARVFADEILGFLNGAKIESALEFGSGTGLVSFCLNDKFGRITLADNSAGMISVLNEKIKSTRAVNMKPLLIDILSEPLPESGFDIIYTLLTLHHIHDVKKTLRIFHNLLKQGAYLCIGDLVTEDGSFHHNDPDFDGHKGFDAEEFKTWLTGSGFRVEMSRVILNLEREQNSVVKKYPLFLLIAKKI